MKKMSTLYKKNPKDLGRVIHEINPENAWALTEGIPTRKLDGTACAIIGGELYKRFDLKEGRVLPPHAIPCQEPDEVTGHHPHWVKCERQDKSNKYHFEAFDALQNKLEGTYELCGEKIQGNPEEVEGHRLFKHGDCVLFGIPRPTTYGGLKDYLSCLNIEGIVFHHPTDERMCKIRKSDFGLER
jgi:hypothetical protein